MGAFDLRVKLRELWGYKVLKEGTLCRPCPLLWGEAKKHIQPLKISKYFLNKICSNVHFKQPKNMKLKKNEVVRCYECLIYLKIKLKCWINSFQTVKKTLFGSIFFILCPLSHRSVIITVAQKLKSGYRAFKVKWKL